MRVTRVMKVLLVVLFVCGIANAQKAEAIKSTVMSGDVGAKAEPVKIDAADQLEVVRLTAEIVDVRAQIQAAEIHKALNERLTDLSQRQQMVLSAILAKLPKPGVGKEWEARPDGKYGVTFVQAEIAKSASKGEQKD